MGKEKGECAKALLSRALVPSAGVCLAPLILSGLSFSRMQKFLRLSFSSDVSDNKMLGQIISRTPSCSSLEATCDTPDVNSNRVTVNSPSAFKRRLTNQKCRIPSHLQCTRVLALWKVARFTQPNTRDPRVAITRMLSEAYMPSEIHTKLEDKGICFALFLHCSISQ